MKCRYLMRMANERINIELIAERNLFPDVFRSSLMRDGVKVGKDMYQPHVLILRTEQFSERSAR